MDGESQSETVGTPNPVSDPSPSLPQPPPVSSSARHHPCPPRHPARPYPFADADVQQIDEVDTMIFQQQVEVKKCTSWVRSEFNLEGEGARDEKACCMHCKHKLSAKSSHGTKHLSDHLRKVLCKMEDAS